MNRIKIEPGCKLPDSEVEVLLWVSLIRNSFATLGYIDEIGSIEISDTNYKAFKKQVTHWSEIIPPTDAQQ